MDENKHAFFARKQNTSASVSTDHLGGKLSRKSLDDGHSGSTGSGGGFSHLFSRSCAFLRPLPRGMSMELWELTLGLLGWEQAGDAHAGPQEIDGGSRRGEGG